MLNAFTPPPLLRAPSEPLASCLLTLSWPLCSFHLFEVFCQIFRLMMTQGAVARARAAVGDCIPAALSTCIPAASCSCFPVAFHPSARRSRETNKAYHESCACTSTRCLAFSKRRRTTGRTFGTYWSQYSALEKHTRSRVRSQWKMHTMHGWSFRTLPTLP